MCRRQDSLWLSEDSVERSTLALLQALLLWGILGSPANAGLCPWNIFIVHSILWWPKRQSKFPKHHRVDTHTPLRSSARALSSFGAWTSLYLQPWCSPLPAGGKPSTHADEWGKEGTNKQQEDVIQRIKWHQTYSEHPPETRILVPAPNNTRLAWEWSQTHSVSHCFHVCIKMNIFIFTYKKKWINLLPKNT